MTTPDARLVLFLDYQNVHGSALRSFWPRGTHPADGHVDPLALGLFLAERRTANGFPSMLSGVRVYRGLPSSTRQPEAAAANERQADAWSRSSSLITVKRRPLRYPPAWPAEKAMEKGVDVAIAVDVVRLGMEGAYDVGVVFSGDTDLLPALEAVIELKCAHVEVAAWRGSNPLRFPGGSAPWCQWLGKSDYATVRDLADYGSRSRGTQ